MAGTEWDGESEEVAAEYEAEEQLDLDDGETRLPWLEGDDDDEEPQVDTAKLIFVGLLGFLLVGALVGGIWWFTRTPGGEIAPDGSTIAAPDEPYKTRPDDPGGKTFEGTGDSSYAVAEGQTREGVIANDATPAPAIDTQQAETVPAAGGVGVQVGAYSSRASAETGWGQLRGRYAMLQGVPHRVVEGQVDSGTVFRLQAVASDFDTAVAMCSELKAAGGACQVKP
jgi:hypothetical protein